LAAPNKSRTFAIREPAKPTAQPAAHYRHTRRETDKSEFIDMIIV